MSNPDFQSEIEKEIQFAIEEEHLKENIELIKKEILNYVEHRKKILNYITEYRKNVLDEYKDDEDKIAEYFDHERYIVEEEFRFIDKKLRELNILSSSPYFGKVDFVEKDDIQKESLYIGRFGVAFKEEPDHMIVDWRSPIASLFYNNKLGENKYIAPEGEISVDVLSKRQFVIKKAKLLGMFDSELNVIDDVLQVMLSKNSSDKLKDIVTTIQEEQDYLIRQPRNKTIVIDGVAGSGKTTVALHRVAYLLYNYRKILQDKVLILGPNDIFIEYISTVLPSLGEVGVKQNTFKEFAAELTGITNVMDNKEYMEKNLKGDKEFIKEVLYKSSIDYIKDLDNLVDKLDESYFNIREIKFFDDIIITKEQIEDMFKNYYKTMPLFRRSKKIKRIIYSKLRDHRDNLVRDINENYKEEISKLSVKQKNLYASNLEFNRRLKIREVISEVINIKNNLQWIENESVIDIYNKFNNHKKLTQDDIAAILYLKIKLEGLTYEREIKHVVIDEAQDYSMLQIIVIKELTKCISMTIVGDSNQRLIPTKDFIAMNHIGEFIDFKEIEYFNLNKSYRSTQEIMEFANNYLKDNKVVPIVRNGEKVEEKDIEDKDKLKDNLINDIKALKNKGYENIAVICKDVDTTYTVGNMLKNHMYVKVIDREDIININKEVIIPSYLAKGLEFDAVIVIDEKINVPNYEKMMYVMATRALHKLYIYNLKYKMEPLN